MNCCYFRKHWGLSHRWSNWLLIKVRVMIKVRVHHIEYLAMIDIISESIKDCSRGGASVTKAAEVRGRHQMSTLPRKQGQNLQRAQVGIDHISKATPAYRFGYSLICNSSSSAYFSCHFGKFCVNFWRYYGKNCYFCFILFAHLHLWHVLHFSLSEFVYYRLCNLAYYAGGGPVLSHPRDMPLTYCFK